MIYNVIGIKSINYVSKKTGRPVSGREFHVIFKDANVRGDAVDKIFVSDRVESSHVNLGDNVNIFYNKFGQVDFIKVDD